MKRTAYEIAKAVDGTLAGDGNVILEDVASLRNAGPSDLTYAEDRFHDAIADTRAGCVIIGSGEFPARTTITVRNPKLAFAQAYQLLERLNDRDRTIHQTAVIASDARLGSSVRIGAGAVIESGAEIGDGSIIESGSYIGRQSRVGRDCVIHPRVVLYHNVQIGDRVIIHSGAVIGADGFGYVRAGAKYVKFPQIGRVIIENDVEIGANTCVDRGSLETTIIRSGVKIDNLVQVAHNVEIGENTVIAAQTGISGSCTIGPDCIIGGQVGMGEHARLDRGTVIGGQGGVLNGKHIKGGTVLWGTPVRPLKEYLLQQAHLVRLPAMAEEIKRLRQEIERLQASE